MLQTIAFYLPQFHSIAENNRWWGEGFTEWDNVRSAVPAFPGHYQPHVPHRSIGYYDLENVDFIVRQHALAHRYGVRNFCYYYYNFNGKTLLEKPLQLILKQDDIKNNFCLCWANGDWTRAWYGQNKEVLIGQEYSIEHARLFMEGIRPYLEHERYIKIAGKPLLLVFQPEIIDICTAYSEVWRTCAQEMGFPDLFLVAVEALEHDVDPQIYGFDAAVEFAPDWRMGKMLHQDTEGPRILDYVTTVANMLAKPKPEYLRFRCVFPGWDNSPRYKRSAVIFQNSTPAAFRVSVESALRYTSEHIPEGKQLLFINAWNEWGEGCHLEPDERHGLAWLMNIRKALDNAGVL